MVIHGARRPRVRTSKPSSLTTRAGRQLALAVRPMLVLQGDRDYQVTAAEDFDGFRRALGGRANVTFRLYPGLNHRFIAGEGPSTPEEYERPGHADARVIADIAGWLGLCSTRGWRSSEQPRPRQQ